MIGRVVGRQKRPQQNMAAVENMVAQNRKVSIAEIIQVLRVSYGSVGNIAAEHLRITARCVPDTLSALGKKIQVEHPNEILT